MRHRCGGTTSSWWPTRWGILRGSCCSRRRAGSQRARMASGSRGRRVARGARGSRVQEGGAGEASRQGEAFVAKRLCRPEGWWTEASTAHRARGNVPKERTGQSQPPWAAARRQALGHERRLPCTDGVAEGLSGKSPDSLDAVEAWVGLTALGARASETRGGLQAPRTMAQTSSETGAARAQRVVVGPDHAPCTVAAVVAHLPASQGSRRPGSAGTPGPRADRCARHRVTLGQAGLPERTVWLVSTRTGGSRPRRR